MKSLFKRLIQWIFEFSKYKLKIKYREEFEIVVSNVMFKRLNLMKKNSVNKILSFNAMIRKIDKLKWYIAMIEYIQKNIESKENLKKHIFDDKQNFRLDTKNLNESTLYKILSNNMKKILYLKKFYR